MPPFDKAERTDPSRAAIELPAVAELLGKVRHPDLKRSLEAYQNDPTDPRALGAAIGVLTNQMSNLDEAHALLETAVAIPELARLRLKADIYESAHRNDEAVALRRRICAAAPAARWHRKRLVSSLIRAGFLDEAEIEIAGLDGEDALIGEIQLANATYRFSDALSLAEQIAESKPGDVAAIRRLLEQLQRSVRAGDEKAHLRARQLLADQSIVKTTDTTTLAKILRLAMSVGLLDLAAELATAEGADNHHPGLVRYRAYELHRAGDLKGARKIWNEIRSWGAIPTARDLRAGELSRLDARPLGTVADEIRLFTVVRNELTRLPWFLDYYRSLGVDRFLFVDNDSTDGTRQYLLAQPDVHVFHTTTSYSEGKSGMVWVNALVREFGRAGWIMYVDVDEAFVYADIERWGLRALTSYMDRKGHEVAAGQMVDMFSTRPFTAPQDSGPVDFVDRYRDFDYEYGRYPQPECPYFFTSGGIRDITGWSANNTKTPLVRAGRDILFLGSSHTVTPAAISDVGIALLHYKFTDDLVDELRKELDNNRTSHCQARYRTYEGLVSEGVLDLSRTGRATIASYESSRSLEAVGLLTPLPRDFR